MENAEKILQEIIELLNGSEGIHDSPIAHEDNVVYVVKDALDKYHEADALLDDIGDRIIR